MADRNEILDVQGAELVVASKLPPVVVQAAVTAAAKVTLAAGDSTHGFFFVCWVASGESVLFRSALGPLRCARFVFRCHEKAFGCGEGKEGVYICFPGVEMSRQIAPLSSCSEED